jgi:chloride channel protein, CIC family
VSPDKAAPGDGATEGAGRGDHTPDDGVTGEVEAFLRSRRYLGLLVIAAILGAFISALAYAFLQLIHSTEVWAYQGLPHGVGLAPTPNWWPLVPLAISGLIVGVTVRYLPGTGGEVPVRGFHPGPPAPASHLPGIALAAIASIALGPVVGPEAPLIALGSGMAVVAIRLIQRGMPDRAAVVIAATGSFAAVSTLLGSPIVGAFLLIEVAGLAGATASLVLVPGLLGAGIGALIFTGLGRLTGHGEFSLAIPHLPTVGSPTIAELGWAVAVGLIAAPLCWLIRRIALTLKCAVERRTVTVTFVISLAIAGLAIAYTYATDKSPSDVLFSGQDQLPGLIENAADYSVGALVLLIACKGLAYAGSLIAFRGGPTFPAMLIGAVGGVALSHLPSLQFVAGVAIGIGAMSVAMLRLPLTCVLLTTLFLGSDGFAVMPLVIVAVVVAHVATLRISPAPGKPGGLSTKTGSATPSRRAG